MQKEETGFGADLATLQILCRQMLVGQRGIVRGVCGAEERGGGGAPGMKGITEQNEHTKKICSDVTWKEVERSPPGPAPLSRSSLVVR
jgi:hypothetical protein